MELEYEIDFKGLPGSIYKLKYSLLSCQILYFVLPSYTYVSI